MPHCMARARNRLRSASHLITRQLFSLSPITVQALSPGREIKSSKNFIEGPAPHRAVLASDFGSRVNWAKHTAAKSPQKIATAVARVSPSGFQSEKQCDCQPKRPHETNRVDHRR